MYLTLYALLLIIFSKVMGMVVTPLFCLCRLYYKVAMYLISSYILIYATRTVIYSVFYLFILNLIRIWLLSL